MVLGLESAGGDFEAKVARDIQASLEEVLIDGMFYIGSVKVDPQHRQEILECLKGHESTYGIVHPIEDAGRARSPTILLIPTQNQAIALGRAIDAAYDACLGSNPLKHIKEVSVSGLIQSSITPYSH